MRRTAAAEVLKQCGGFKRSSASVQTPSLTSSQHLDVQPLPFGQEPWSSGKGLEELAAEAACSIRHLEWKGRGKAGASDTSGSAMAGMGNVM